MAKNEFRLNNLSCANCANKFEKNLNELPNIDKAVVNFGASKVTVIGDVTEAEINGAGAFDGITVASVKKQPFYQKKENKVALIALLFVIAGYITDALPNGNAAVTTALFLIAIIVGGTTIFIAGFRNLMKLDFDMKALMTIAVIGAAIIGEWKEAAVVVFLFAVSEALEAYSMDKARQSIRSLMDIAPTSATVRRANEILQLKTEDIQINDVLLIKPGEKIAMDGVVVKGHSTVNQAAITGESLPVEKNIDDEVFAGTLNDTGVLEVIVTKRVADTTIAKIIHLVEEAQAEKAPSQQFVDRFAKYYTPAIMLIALLVAIIPGLVTGHWAEWIYQGLAVLVVGCPCALIISTPVAIVTAIGNAAKQGVLIKGGIHLEELGHVKAIAFDKTGTLTRGTPEVVQAKMMPLEGIDALAYIAAVEKDSQHPLANAVTKYAEQGSFAIAESYNFHSVTGKGVQATVEGREVLIGSIAWIHEKVTIDEALQQEMTALQQSGHSLVVAAIDAKFAGYLAIADQLRTNAAAVLQSLHKLGIKERMMLTGDAQSTAEAIASSLDLTAVRAELMPADKLREIQTLQKQYKVAMIGDGVNDAPALAAASVGIAMGGAGTDTALETADVALMADDLEKLPYTIKLSRKTVTIIKQNISFALGLKAIALLLVIPGWLTLWIAIFADMGATLIVVLNALRLLKVKK